jgi:hypothetical protein
MERGRKRERRRGDNWFVKKGEKNGKGGEGRGEEEKKG